MEMTTKGIPLTLRPALQEYDLDQLDPDEHAFSIMERTLAYGQREEIKWLFQHYGVQPVADWIRQAGWRLLPRRRLAFWSAYFDLPDLSIRNGVWQH